MIDLKRYTQLAVAWSRHGSLVPTLHPRCMQTRGTATHARGVRSVCAGDDEGGGGARGGLSTIKIAERGGGEKFNQRS